MSEIITTLEEPKFDKWRETRFEYTESFGESYKSISVETYLTNDELVAIVRELRSEGE